MPDVIVANFPIAHASLEQFAGLVSHAGEVATNLFVAGGKAIILRVGHYEQGTDPNTGQLVENFLPGINPKNDELLLQALCDRDPARGLRDMNPFVLNLWPLTNETNRQPTSIVAALGEKMSGLAPVVSSPKHFIVEMSSGEAMYLLKKAISSVFAVALIRGCSHVEFILMRGDEVIEDIFVQKIVKTKKMVNEKQRDPKTGNLMFKEAIDEKGQPIYDAVCNKAGQPLYDPNTGEIRRQRKLEFVTKPVEQEVETLVQETQKAKRVPIYLQVTKAPEIDSADFLGASINDSQYDPTWMLVDVLSGKCASKKPFHGMGE